MSIYAEYLSISNISRKQLASRLALRFRPEKPVDRLKGHTLEVPAGLFHASTYGCGN